MTKKEFKDEVWSTVSVAINRSNEYLKRLDLCLVVNWDYDFDSFDDGAIGVYEGGSVFGGEITVSCNVNELYKYFRKYVKEYPYSDLYTILEEMIYTNIYHEMGHGLVELISDYLNESDDLDELYDSNQELFDYIFDNEEDAVEEFAWCMYENRLDESGLYKVIELYLSLNNEGIMENMDKRIDRIIRESIEDYFNDLNSRNELTPWDSETKMDRMRPTNASRSQGSVPTRDFGVIRGYNDWRENFKQVMDYPSYCKKFGVRR